MEGDVLLNELMHGGPARKLLILNGVVYWLNNQMNFLVLEKVTPHPITLTPHPHPHSNPSPLTSPLALPPHPHP